MSDFKIDWATSETVVDDAKGVVAVTAEVVPDPPPEWCTEFERIATVRDKEARQWSGQAVYSSPNRIFVEGVPKGAEDDVVKYVDDIVSTANAAYARIAANRRQAEKEAEERRMELEHDAEEMQKRFRAHGSG
jgi:hypothetical protein